MPDFPSSDFHKDVIPVIVVMGAKRMVYAIILKYFANLFLILKNYFPMLQLTVFTEK